MIDISQVPVADYNLYFNGTYLKYQDRIWKAAPGADGGRTTLMLTHDRETIHVWRKPELRNVEVWWPRPGAYNYRGSAAYIARKASRCMRKSCSPRHHYYLKWGGGGMGGPDLIRYLRNGPNHMTYAAAKEALDKRLCTSVAVCRDLILTRVKDGYDVVYRGEKAGSIIGGDYHPENHFSPVNKLVAMRLAEEGIV